MIPAHHVIFTILQFYIDNESEEEKLSPMKKEKCLLFSNFPTELHLFRKIEE